MDYPEYVIVDGKKLKMNTDFKNAIECIKIGYDDSIGNRERALAIIYKIFGREGLECEKNYEQLLDLAGKFLRCGEDCNDEQDADMDFIEDYDYIDASFMSDYHLDLSNCKMHWWKFYKLVCGLSNSDLGNCCILNRIRAIRNANPDEIKDARKRDELLDQQKRFSLKRRKEKHFTEKQQKNVEDFYKLIGKEGGINK